MPIDPNAFDVLTFDCYGTLIDWETRAARRRCAPARRTRSRACRDDDLLEAYADDRARGAGALPALPRRAGAVARRARAPLRRRCRTRRGARRSRRRSPDWPAFPDSHEALARLQTRYRLMPITNCDDDLFAGSAARLGITFDDVVTAQQAGAYKPDERPFRWRSSALGVPQERDPARRAEPLARPRHRAAPGPHERLDQSPRRPCRRRGDALRRRRRRTSSCPTCARWPTCSSADQAARSSGAGGVAVAGADDPVASVLLGAVERAVGAVEQLARSRSPRARPTRRRRTRR